MKKKKNPIKLERAMIQQMTPSVLSDLLKTKVALFMHTGKLSEFLATISGILLTVTLGMMTTETFSSLPPIVKLGILTIVGSSLLTICMCLLIIEPDIEKNRDSNSFDYGVKLSDLTREKYIEIIRNTVGNPEKIIDTYGHELHRLDTDILRRFKAIKVISYMFLTGIVVGGATIVVASLL
jgi:hypothetical protein